MIAGQLGSTITVQTGGGEKVRLNISTDLREIETGNDNANSRRLGIRSKTFLKAEYSFIHHEFTKMKKNK